MKDESTNDPRNDATGEERLMALLALTAQELPHVPHDAAAPTRADVTADADRFQRLDSDPAALEAYLREGMRAPRQSNLVAEPTWQRALHSLAEWLAPPRVRFAAAFSVVFLASVVTFWQWNAYSILNITERGYAGVNLTMPADALILPWEQRTPVQGFAASAGNDTPGGRAFAQGLLRGQARLVGRLDDSQSVRAAAATERYVALGEWNVLLWAAVQSGGTVDQDFWGAQAALARKLGDEFKSTDDAQVIAAHTIAAETLLAEMARAPTVRTARQLGSELTRFREAFAPHTPPGPDPVTRQ